MSWCYVSTWSLLSTKQLSLTAEYCIFLFTLHTAGDIVRVYRDESDTAHLVTTTVTFSSHLVRRSATSLSSVVPDDGRNLSQTIVSANYSHLQQCNITCKFCTYPLLLLNIPVSPLPSNWPTWASDSLTGTEVMQTRKRLIMEVTILPPTCPAYSSSRPPALEAWPRSELSHS